MNKWGIAAKAIRVIESCETIEQLEVACNYYALAAKRIIKSIKHSRDEGALHYNYDWDVLHTGLDLINSKLKLLTQKGGNE